jgi:ABC-type branched-subunit amino acid transport system ATPase component/branched-subunit amino acid ABC-type transport system permease component
MHDLLPFIVIGLVSGSLYALIGTGLVLTFTTSGLFNFGHGAIATLGAYAFYVLHVQHHVAWPLAGLVSVVVVGVILGAILERFGKALTDAPQAMKIVGTIGLILLVQGSMGAIFKGQQTEVDQFLPTKTFELFGIFVGWEQAIVILIGLTLVAILYVFFRVTRTGTAMRAVVDDPGLLAAQGTDPSGVRRYAWMIGAIFACLSGVLLVPIVGLNPITLTLLVVPGFGAAAIGGFSSLPLTYAGGLLIGILEALCTKWWPGTGFLSGLAPSLPFIALVIVLVALPARRLVVRREAKPVIIRRWRAPARVQVALTVVVAGYLLLVPVIAKGDLLMYTGALSTVVVLLSLGLLVRTSGQVSLAHVGFMAIGAAAFAHFSAGAGLPWGVALVLAMLVGVPVGVLVALPAIRLSGVYLALATLGFGILLERMFYNQKVMFSPFVSGRAANRPHLDWVTIDKGNGYYYLSLAIGACGCLLALMIHRARLGRLLRGLSGSATAMQTLGTSTTALRMIVFAISASMAALAGALYASTTERTAGALFPSFTSLVYFTLLAIMIGEMPWFAIFGAFSQVILPSFFHSDSVTLWFNALFGFFAIQVAMTSTVKEPPGARQMRAFFDRIGGRRPVSPELEPSASRPAEPVHAAVRGDRSGLRVQEITVKFGSTMAVNGLSLEAPLGRITGLIGPNGAGKTTTFNACGGLVKPTRGRIFLNGEDVSSKSPASRARRGLGRTFQIMQLFESLTVEENVSMGAEAALAGGDPRWQVVSRPKERAAMRAVAEAAAELTGVSAYWHRTVSELTTGQRRLVELARCLAGNFDVLLLDEPSSGLDNDETRQFGEVLKVVVRDRGVGILLVEHDMTLVMDTCEYIYVMDFGFLLAEGTPAEVSASDAVRVAYLGEAAEGNAVSQPMVHAVEESAS